MRQRSLLILLFPLALQATAAARAGADVPDVTDSLEYLFAPMESRYGTDARFLSSRAVHCLDYVDGRIYVGGGDWDKNTGPVPIISILPGDRPTWTNEYSAGTETLESFKRFSDGRVWTRATDPREGDANQGYFFARHPGGEWRRCRPGYIDWSPAHELIRGDLYTHAWDFCEYKGSFYFTGYGVGGSKRWLNDDDTFSKKMWSVTEGQTNGYHRYVRFVGSMRSEGRDYERFMTLMPFDGGCIAVTWHWYESRQPDLNPCYFWRLDESTGKFRQEECPWSALLDGYADVDRELFGRPPFGWWIHFREATPFKGRVYYIVAPGCSMNVPIGFFSAAMDASGTVTSRRHAFDGGHSHPIDIAVVGGAMYVMTVRYESPSSIAHAIWKTKDGRDFTKLATFTTDQYFESFTYAKGHFYLGYGCANLGSSPRSPAKPATDKAGQIWRFALPQDDDNETPSPQPNP